ncbi:NuoI/complex I 23 kDa subunit family protein [Campylobacter fetus]|uniref:NADH-quinone oxidoreductase subunit I n=1 Tax=Campylobacter fetus subsp. testudinum TaxID=1507806 RepID=A0AAX0H9E5_CAMFE|nr:NADH-quinone oxidoreductase subunit I [Campylobacter fetus]AGZ81063.1 NADH:quinone oxidoreductase I, chain I [Campylobacter fetus subsp. testudinum 03-427]AJB44819.1 NADH-quinone oxidoreductase subunit I [Campylobacter fetus subsp. testudinum]ALV64157.1 NADH:quinone oxidoreductase I, chain I [Campylobacter fetus subsp. testudinum Sp3]AVK80442.1 NADH-quinone oxidoreductase subunit I [Campylobacter fetus subsp. testudinum]EAI4322799.1 NADH-quinone oxidoreductase subunit I [Campylobacter fetus
MAIKTKTIRRKKIPFLQRIYLPFIFAGMARTFKHFFRNLKDSSNIDFLEYPEQKPTDITNRYRGLHRLTKNEKGDLKCVACDMCATACPANCIFITATEIEGSKEKAPSKFTIDLLECVFCGLCVEACPKDAIRMDTGIFTKVGNTRESFLADIKTLSQREEGSF